MTDLSKNEYIGECIKAQADDLKNVLILRKLPSPFKRCDGRRVSYELEYRWLTVDPTPEGDEVCGYVRGQDFTYWSKRALDELGALDKDSELFDCFNLF
jgi:hypothetical protein